MEESILTRIFPYRQRETLSPLENFLTESFAFCLETDAEFRKDFFKTIKISYTASAEFKIATQSVNEEYGRPDIEIRYRDTFIIIESKVESIEGKNQLEKYANILLKDTSSKKKYLVYLTKYIENKELTHNHIELSFVRWCDIYRFINKSHKELTQQLKYFLKDKGMETVKNFTLQDFIVMKTKRETEKKMDELLNYFKPIFQKTFGSFQIVTSREGSYFGVATVKFQSKEYYIGLGFFCYEDFEVPFLELYVNLPNKKFSTSEIHKTFRKEFRIKKDWEYDDEGIEFSVDKQISDFMIEEDDNIPAMKKFIDKHLHTLFALKKKYPKYFRK